MDGFLLDPSSVWLEVASCPDPKSLAGKLQGIAAASEAMPAGGPKIQCG